MNFIFEWQNSILRMSATIEARAATGKELFSYSTCLHITTFLLLSIFSFAEEISLKIWDRPLSWHAKCSLPVSVRDSKTSLAIPSTHGQKQNKKD